MVSFTRLTVLTSVQPRRVTAKLRDEMFQLWCEGIEAKIIKKIKVDKMRSQSRIFWLTGTYR